MLRACLRGTVHTARVSKRTRTDRLAPMLTATILTVHVDPRLKVGSLLAKCDNGGEKTQNIFLVTTYTKVSNIKHVFVINCSFIVTGI